jgi:hypothetical protein
LVRTVHTLNVLERASLKASGLKPGDLVIPNIKFVSDVRTQRSIGIGFVVSLDLKSGMLIVWWFRDKTTTRAYFERLTRLT